MRARVLSCFTAAVAVAVLVQPRAQFSVFAASTTKEESAAASDGEAAENEGTNVDEVLSQEDDAPREASTSGEAEREADTELESGVSEDASLKKSKELLRAAISHSISALGDIFGPGVVDPQTLQEDIDEAVAALLAVSAEALDALGLSEGSQTVRLNRRATAVPQTQQKRRGKSEAGEQSTDHAPRRQKAPAKELSSQDDEIEEGMNPKWSEEEMDFM